MYVEELALLGDHSKVPLTRISCNMVFSKSQNGRKTGTLCTSQPGLPGIYLIVALIEALQPSFVVIAVLNFQCTAWACSTSRNSDSTIRIIDDQMSLSSFLSTVLCGFIIRTVTRGHSLYSSIQTHNTINLGKDISNSGTKTGGLNF
jgi:hypothetical protein